MGNWGSRLKEIREKHEYSHKQIGDAIDKDVTQVSRYERGGGAQKMPKHMRIDFRGLFSQEEIAYIEYGFDKEDDTSVYEPSQHYNENDTLSIPYYPDIYASAGGGAVVYDSLTGTEPMRLSRAFVEDFLCVPFSKHIHVINVKGDSMAPTIIDGELIFVSPLNGNGIVDGHIYVIMYEDDIYVKRIRKVPFSKRFKLISDNEDVGDVELTEEQTAACTVVGEVVGQMRRNG
ncbi:MAG: S24 family peptidase [Saccharofermentanales bacterium]